MGKQTWDRPTGFGERLRQLREARGLTQRGLAEAAGCNQFTVAKLERGQQEPAWPLVLALAGALGASVSDFLPPGAPAPPGEEAALAAEIRGYLEALCDQAAVQIARRVTGRVPPPAPTPTGRSRKPRD